MDWKIVEEGLVKNAEHAVLFYEYRNNLVHEFRESGYGMEFSDDGTSPYYHGMADGLDIKTWELVYPVDFFIAVANSTVSNLKNYLQENRLDPRQYYQFGSIWKHPRRQNN